jgi:hypothetical protein
MDSPCSPPKPKRSSNDAFASSQHTAADDRNPKTVRSIQRNGTLIGNDFPQTSVPPTCSSFDDAITLASSHVWNVPKLRQLRNSSCSDDKLLEDPILCIGIYQNVHKIMDQRFRCIGSGHQYGME